MEYSNITLKMLILGQWPSNVACFWWKMKWNKFQNYLRHFLHKKSHLWLVKWKIFFYYKIIANSYATLSTMVTPLVVPNLGMLSWILPCMWPFPCAYALKSTQVHSRLSNLWMVFFQTCCIASFIFFPQTSAHKIAQCKGIWIFEPFSFSLFFFQIGVKLGVLTIHTKWFGIPTFLVPSSSITNIGA